MQVTNDMIARGDVAVLPVGWQKFGTIHDALSALREQWHQQHQHEETPTGWGLIVSADATRAIVTELLVRRLPGRGELMVQVAPNDPEGRGLTREVAMDFDVVCPRTGFTLAEARQHV